MSRDGSSVHSSRARIATWNLDWPSRAGQQSAREHLDRLEADVVVTTEDRLRPWPVYPGAVDAGNDWGYKARPDQRKVIAWSRAPWTSIDVDTPGAAKGRLIVATSSAAEVDFTVVGVCIPWKMAHVSTGRRDRKHWEEHLEFCEVLGGVLHGLESRGPIVVAGDFNQRVPYDGQPAEVWESLCTALRGYEVATNAEAVGRPLIDHIALRGATAADVGISQEIADGEPLPVHPCVWADIDRLPAT